MSEALWLLVSSCDWYLRSTGNLHGLLSPCCIVYYFLYYIDCCFPHCIDYSLLGCINCSLLCYFDCYFDYYFDCYVDCYIG